MDSHPLYTFIQEGYATALWRLPQTDTIQSIVDFRRVLPTQTPVLETAPQGFWISPFLNENLTQTYFIQADWKAEKKGKTWNLPTNLPTEKLNFQTVRPYLLPTPKIAYNKQTEHEMLVQKGIEAISAGKMRKLVIARAKVVAYPENFDILQTFEKLCLTYPTAFCYFFHLPQIGTWMGATPETLIGLEGKEIFKTIALAGTQAYKGQAVRDALWSQKEIEEQALVSRYIINCFKKIRLREFEEDGPKTVIAGHLMHLQTNFWVNMHEVDFPNLGSEMLHLLHPTSAVCGMPRAESQAFLLAHEGYDRQFYSGFLGTSNFDNNTQLFVNLRCMQLTSQGLVLYAGGGITIDSLPEKEWQETELKMKIMENVLWSVK
jgi:isochorismate synthase